LKRLLPRHGQLLFERDIWSILSEAAAALVQPSSPRLTASDVNRWLRAWSRYKMGPAAAKHAMLRSVAVAQSVRPHDIPFALGESWRKLYPQLVPLISFGGLAAGQWQRYFRTNREMERIAFGPPAEHVAKLLRLIRERVVTLGIDDRNERARRGRSDDAVLNAVIASPTERAPNGPLAKLIAEGIVQVDAQSGAVRVGRDGFTGEHGLAVFGRATEGWIVGNDTLSRTMHPQIECWAQRVRELIPSSTTPPPLLPSPTTPA
ncbi:MAG: hypothetical protein ACF788_10900, partial [Novipirellula sp. JB048]